MNRQGDESLSPYYEHLTIKPWDYCEANNLGFTVGCIIKYLSRYQHKDGMRDLLKARACIDALIEREHAKQQGEHSWRLLPPLP